MIDSDSVTTPDGGVEVLVEYDDEEEPIQVIAQALAGIEDTRVTDLDPLYDTVDAEALSQLLRHANRHDCDVGVEFTYGEFTVSVGKNGRIRIHGDPPRIARVGGDRGGGNG